MHLRGEDATEALGATMAGALKAGDVVALFGDLGVGKTTFSRGILRGLGFSGEVASPTFPIIQAYDAPDVSLPIWHVDLYRIEDPAELEELALDEALGHAALLVEWPERLGRGLWRHALRLHLSTAGEGARALTAEVPPAWEGRWPPR
ncbi:MAG TPA: tRNA (adenosine(37)-N6)-threonylcarbamoyltransferase complex ATPase subunit type 1 TsaE [Allosphingosinicella sp.]|uniref:tRNA (adenosine(37)-N6)-threonylcarbamoyltransferase complex ATPase subunit type 1 TsaE n=1 Tax=Allosphingosinicella sp. TaxID=2823234 RepID=UPI002ED7FC95